MIKGININKKTVGGAFLAALILLILFSKTIYAFNLPKVTAVAPVNGKLSKLETGSGVVNWADVENLYATVGGKVDEIFVREGDHVSKGQELMRLAFDRDDTENRLAETENSRKKLYAEIQGINLRLDKTRRYINELKSDSYDASTLASEINRAKKELENAELMYEMGGISAYDLEKARSNMKELYLKQESQKTGKNSKLKDYEAEITSLKLDLQNKQIELGNLDIQKKTYVKMLEDFDEYTVLKASEDGVVTTIDAEKGEYVNENRLLAVVGISGMFHIDCTISRENNFITTGDTCELSNSSYMLEGTVTKVEPDGAGKIVTIAFTSEEVTAGETFDIIFEKQSATSYTLVPNGALNQDNDGYYLNQVKRRDGILGKEYYLERLDVYIGDSDANNTAILRGITFFEPVALSSDRQVSPGDIISLKNGGDFFEK